MVTKSPSGELSSSFSAVAIYDCDPYESKALANFRRVVAGVEGPQKENLFMKDMADALTPDYRMTNNAPAALDILTGKHASQFRLTMVEAAHNGKKVYLPVIDDMLLGKTLVVGPAGIPAGVAGQHTTYVSAKAPDAVDSVNEFLRSGAYVRGMKGLLDLGDSRALIEDMVCAVAICSDIASVTPGAGRIIPGNATVGGFLVPIARGEVEMAAYSVAKKLPAKAARTNASKKSSP